MLNSDNNKLSLAATNGHKVEFYDPIQNYNGNPNLTITINEGDDKIGTVLFDMSNNAVGEKTSAIYGDTTVYHGTFAMKGGAVYGANGNSGTFTLQNSATLNVSDNAQINGDADLFGTVDLTNGNLEVNGDLVFGSDSVLKMTVGENKIVADSVKIDGKVEIDLSTIPTNGQQINNIIVSRNTPLDPTTLDSLLNLFLNSNKLLTHVVYDNNSIGFESLTAEQYTTQNNFRKNQIKIAALLDNYTPIKTFLQSLDTREQLEGLVKSLLAPELAAAAQELPLNSPYFRVFNHVNNLQFNNLRNTNSSTTFRGQSACSPVGCNIARGNYEFWFEGYYQGGETHGDSNALSYKTSRGGMMVGVDQYFGDGLLTGLIFGYGNPRVYNSVGKVEADDYTFGAYSRLKIFGIYANAFLGYGSQNYQLRQNINPNQHTNYNGDSFYASLELFQPINLRNNLSISPLLAIDFQKAWSDGFKTNTYIPLAVNKSDIDQTILRVGVNSNYKNLRTRLQYGYQVAGDHYGISRTSIIGGDGNRILTGVNLGRHSLNVGFGGDFKISNRTKLFADYDFDLGKHSINHTGQFGFVRYF